MAYILDMVKAMAVELSDQEFAIVFKKSMKEECIMKSTVKIRLIAMLLCLIMLVGSFPMTAFGLLWKNLCF